MKSFEEFVEESLKYDRASSRMQVVIADLIERRRDDKRFDLSNGDAPDKSFDIIINDLKKLQKEYREESDRMWAKVELYKGVNRRAWEDLANAIVKMAIEDYERTISGKKSESEKMLIEKFAEDCDNGYMNLSKLKITALLKRVNLNHEKFIVYAHEHSKEIMEETARLKKLKKEARYSQYRCPNCGGGLYETVMYGIHRATCTGCFLSEVISIDKKKKI